MGLATFTFVNMSLGRISHGETTVVARKEVRGLLYKSTMDYLKFQLNNRRKKNFKHVLS